MSRLQQINTIIHKDFASKIQILWLDDFFRAEADPIEKGVLIDQIKKFESKGISVISVGTEEEFSIEIEKFERFQAIILDLRLNPDDSDDTDFLYNSLDKIRTAKLPIYIFSANTDDSSFKDLKRNYNIVGSFKKPGAIQDLVNTILDDIKKDSHIFVGYDGWEYIAHSGYLKADSAILFRNIAINFREKNIHYIPYNDMRKVLEDLIKAFIIRLKSLDYKLDVKPLNSMIQQICEFCNSKMPNGEWNREDPLVPYGICPKRIKSVISFLNSITQTGSHSDGTIEERYNPTPEDISRISEYRYHDLLVESAFLGFSLFIKWIADFFKANE